MAAWGLFEMGVSRKGAKIAKERGIGAAGIVHRAAVGTAGGSAGRGIGSVEMT